MSGRIEGLRTADVSMVMVGALRRPCAGESWLWLKGFESDMVVAGVAPQECRTPWLCRG